MKLIRSEPMRLLQVAQDIGSPLQQRAFPLSQSQVWTQCFGRLGVKHLSLSFNWLNVLKVRGENVCHRQAYYILFIAWVNEVLVCGFQHWNESHSFDGLYTIVEHSTVFTHTLMKMIMNIALEVRPTTCFFWSFSQINKICNSGMNTEPCQHRTVSKSI